MLIQSRYGSKWWTVNHQPSDNQSVDSDSVKFGYQAANDGVSLSDKVQIHLEIVKGNKLLKMKLCFCFIM